MLNISIIRAKLIDNLKNINNNKIRSKLAKFIYNIKYNYNYMDNLPMSFINLMLILEDNNYRIDYKDYKLALNITFKNIIYIDSKDYKITLNIDKIKWICDLDFNDNNNNYGFNYTIDLHNNIKLDSLLLEYEQILYNILQDLFTNLFIKYIKNI